MQKETKSKLNEKFQIIDGVLKWKASDCKRIKPGEDAGCKRKNGYIYVNLDGKIKAAHRIVWEMHHGCIPDDMYIDHINHIRSDNRIENLRLVSRIDNARNSNKSKANRSGVTGVSWNGQKRRWRAQITIFNRSINLGNFIEFNDAVNARKEAEDFYGFHENHGK